MFTDFDIGSFVIIINIGHYFLPIAYLIFILTQRLEPEVGASGVSPCCVLQEHLV